MTSRIDRIGNVNLGSQHVLSQVGLGKYIQHAEIMNYLLEIHVFTTTVFVCLFGVYRPTREFFTHLETSLLPVKGCKF